MVAVEAPAASERVATPARVGAGPAGALAEQRPGLARCAGERDPERGGRFGLDLMVRDPVANPQPGVLGGERGDAPAVAALARLDLGAHPHRKGAAVVEREQHLELLGLAGERAPGERDGVTGADHRAGPGERR